MYYTFKCPYCRKLFYTHLDNKTHAAEALYHGIKRHQVEYGEDEKEYTMDDEHLATEINRVYSNLDETDDEPSGYEV